MAGEDGDNTEASGYSKIYSEADQNRMKKFQKETKAQMAEKMLELEDSVTFLREKMNGMQLTLNEKG